jgi:SOS response regulatory protein OraA/RecX
LPKPVKSAVEIAARALARRDRSESDLTRILIAKGVPEAEASAAVDTLRRVGAVDDGRFAGATAEALAARGFGDAAIIVRLQREGIPTDAVHDAVSQLQPEFERAAALAAARPAGGRTARWLAARGFSADSVEQVLTSVAETDAAELG